MLGEFVLANREEIVDRCSRKVAERESPPSSQDEIDHGVPMFLEALMNSLRVDPPENVDLAGTAAKHGRDLLRRGFTPPQVVHDYGDICQTITALVIETNTLITAEDFRTLNRCLDDAIAAAITEYGRERDASASALAIQGNNRVRVLAAALRSSVLAARVAFEAIQSGGVGIGGSTGMVLARNLKGIEDLNERMQVELPLP